MISIVSCSAASNSGKFTDSVARRMTARIKTDYLKIKISGKCYYYQS